MTHRPPCWPVGQPCPNPCAAAHYERLIYNRQHLGGPWAGWRMAGRELVSPDGDRISPERMRGILWREELEKRRRRSTQAKQRVSRMVTVLRIDQDDWHRTTFGNSIA